MKGVMTMPMLRGYYTNGDYMGYVPMENDYMRFPSDTEYKEYMEMLYSAGEFKIQVDRYLVPA